MFWRYRTDPRQSQIGAQLFQLGATTVSRIPGSPGYNMPGSALGNLCDCPPGTSWANCPFCDSYIRNGSQRIPRFKVKLRDTLKSSCTKKLGSVCRSLAEKPEYCV